ncbi:hypothetical protein P886_3079 [Alteromonadaceae bacterium 2753L.S.0a.02]|nr:hypothetical protein P886_3079 [Alteromonadaceae bacterium 2753L.S.0a.02]
METTDSVNIQVWITGLIALSAYIGLVWQFIVSNRIRKQEVDRDNFTRDTTQNTQILSFFQFLRDYQSEINRLNVSANRITL